MPMAGIIGKIFARSGREAPEPEAPCDAQTAEPVEWRDMDGAEDGGEENDSWLSELRAAGR